MMWPCTVKLPVSCSTEPSPQTSPLLSLLSVYCIYLGRCNRDALLVGLPSNNAKTRQTHKILNVFNHTDYF